MTDMNPSTISHPPAPMVSGFMGRLVASICFVFFLSGAASANASVGEQVFTLLDERCLPQVSQLKPLETVGLKRLSDSDTKFVDDYFGSKNANEYWISNSPQAIVLDSHKPRLCMVLGVNLEPDVLQMSLAKWQSRNGAEFSVKDKNEQNNGSGSHAYYVKKGANGGFIQVIVNHVLSPQNALFIHVTNLPEASKMALEVLGAESN